MPDIYYNCYLLCYNYPSYSWCQEATRVKVSGEFYEALGCVVNLAGSPYGYQYMQDLPLKEVTQFVSDYYAIRYLVANTLLTAYDISNLLIKIGNLLRECEEYGINEIFMGNIRLRRSIDDKWVIMER